MTLSAFAHHITTKQCQVGGSNDDETDVWAGRIGSGRRKAPDGPCKVDKEQVWKQQRVTQEITEKISPLSFHLMSVMVPCF